MFTAREQGKHDLSSELGKAASTLELPGHDFHVLPPDFLKGKHNRRLPWECRMTSG